MEYKAFLIKYAEIGIKGNNRYMFENALVKQMKFAFKGVGKFTVRKQSGRVFAEAQGEFDFDEAVAALKTVFGITGICPVLIDENKDIEHLGKICGDYMKEEHPDAKTFKVFAKRADKRIPLNSMELAAEMGGYVLDAVPGIKVDVHNPEVKLTVEVRDKVYIYSKVIPGPGGMPIGTNGKAMLCLSGGIDSPVAGWMIAKRGVRIDATYFHAPPYTSERAKQKVVDLAKKVARYAGPINLHIVNFTDIQLAIYEKCPHDELTIIMRRYMMKIAEHFAKQQDCLALITGESIGQVASQTIHNLAITNEVCELPVFRPCIGMDKQEIVDIAEEIDTYETSILPFEDCCTIFVAKHPVTKGDLSRIKKSERALDDVIDDLMKAAIESTEIMYVKPE
ncbi:MAG: tRNA 4-thiouridine(8) synthase ThiI [Lachnospiraceae bacterium]|nr:tRNA 4-thiouridine(8) synthase ThiI [Lachnospiraceae bacterium]